MFNGKALASEDVRQSQESRTLERVFRPSRHLEGQNTLSGIQLFHTNDAGVEWRDTSQQGGVAGRV